MDSNLSLPFFFPVDIPVMFPTEQPDISLLSVYHVNQNGGPFFKTYTEYPYSPRWSGDQMAVRARYFIYITACFLKTMLMCNVLYLGIGDSGVDIHLRYSSH